MTTRPRHRTLSLLPALLTLLCGRPAHAQQVAGLQQRMSASEFKAAGLDKLSPQELANLDSWLAGHGKVVTKVVSASGKPVFYTDESRRKPIDAHIVGHFSGWNGHNLVTLDNGQQWQQIGSDQPYCGASDNPVAKIKPSLFGNWLMYAMRTAGAYASLATADPALGESIAALFGSWPAACSTEFTSVTER